MREKILFCATVDYHFKSFHLPILKWFKEQGWEVHVAAFGEIELPFVDEKFNIPIQRSPFKRKNIRAYQELKQIIHDHQYKIIHCHTPMGGVLTRIAARKARKNELKVIYTAHGFHFCKGAPLMNWLLYYPIEKTLAHYTDCLITINNEDYSLAVNHRFHAGIIEHVHGVGVDTEHFKPIDEDLKREQREKLGYKVDDFLLFYAAEFNKNKNQQFLIRALALIKDHVPNAKLLLAGEGDLLVECKKLASELDVDRMVDFLGYRNDICSILPICDVAVASSLREGLPVNIMEAMACGLPVVATENRGHSQLVKSQENGFIVDSGNIELFSNRIEELGTSKKLCETFGKGSLRMIKQFALISVSKELHSIYARYMLRDTDETKDKYNRAYI